MESLLVLLHFFVILLIKALLLFLIWSSSICQERLEDIERDQREYTFDEEDRKVTAAILKPDPSENDAMVLKKTLSCSYPNLPFDEALKKENEKLQEELQMSQANMDINQCEVIQRLLDATETMANSLPEKSPSKDSKKVEPNVSDANNGHSFSDSYARQHSDTHTSLRLVSISFSI